MIPRRLATKLILSLTVIVAVVEGVAGYINVRTQERQLLDAMILGADQLSKGIVSATWHAMLDDNREAAYEVIQTIALKQGIDQIQIYNREGKIMFSTKPTEAPRVAKNSDVCMICHSAATPRVAIDAPLRSRILPAVDGGTRKLAMVSPIYNEAACSQAACHAHSVDTKVLGVLDVRLTLDTVDQEIDRAKITILIVAAIQTMLIALFTIGFTRYFVDRPIRKLIAGTKAVSELDLKTPIDIGPGGSEELNDLARSFDLMRERLHQSVTALNELAHSLETKVRERTEQLNIAQRKLLQSDRLASLGQLSASVAHEINNPLSGVLNLSMLIQRIMNANGIPPDRLPEVRQYLTQVINETSRVGRIVKDLLAFSRRPKPQRTLVDLNDIIRSTVAIIDHKLRMANVSKSLDLDPGLPRIACDGSQMQQVFINLIMNAAEATQRTGGGHVTVRTRTGTNNDVIFTVSDNGEGIPPQNIARIFDPFFTTKEEGKGVGLGLSVVYGIVDSHGGDIDVASTVGRGTEFTVTLPIMQPEMTPPARPAATVS